jgi:hypothetical protein
MLISVVEVDPQPAVTPPVLVTIGALFQGDATMTADIHTSRVTTGAVAMQGDAFMSAFLNVESRMKAFMQGDATMTANVSNTKYITGDRTASIQCKYSGPLTGGGTRWEVLPNLVNGSFATSGIGSIIVTGGQTGQEFTFDFRPSGFMQVVDEIKWYQDVSASQGGWRCEAWDGETWTVLNAGFTLGVPATQIIPLSNSKPYFVYRFIQQSGVTNATPFIEEVEFKQQQGPAITAVDAGTKYTYTGGTGDRRTPIPITTTFTVGTGVNEGPVTILDDGSTNGLGPFVNFTPTGLTGKQILFDNSSMGPQIIDEFKIYHGNGFDTGYFRMQGTQDGVSWTDIGTWFLIQGVPGGGVRTYSNLIGNMKGWKQHRMIQMPSATNTGGLLSEVEFKIVPAIAADMVGDTDMFADTISGDGGSGSSLGATSYNNPDGKGNRAGSVFIATSAGLINQGTIGELINGDIHVTSLSLKFNAVTDGKITFDFGNPRVIDAFIWWQGGALSHGIWRWYGSNDNVAFVATGNTFDLHGPSTGAGVEYLEPHGNTTAYRYWQLRQISGTAAASLDAEIWFRIAGVPSINMGAAFQGDADMTAVLDEPTILVDDQGNAIVVDDVPNKLLVQT